MVSVARGEGCKGRKTTEDGRESSDDGAVEGVELYIDGKLLATDTTTPYGFYWDTSAYADGNYELWAIAYDSTGNEGQSDFITVSVSNEIFRDTAPPDVAITSPRDGASISDRVTIIASASDDDGISKMELRLDGVLKVVKSKSSLTYRWNARKASRGAHTISVRAFDAAGSVGEHSITVYK